MSSRTKLNKMEIVPSNILWTQSHERNHKAWDQCMGSLPIVLGRKIWGNVTKVFVDDSFGIVAQTLQFCFPKSLVRISLAHFAWRNPSKRVLGNKTGNDPEGIINKDLKLVPSLSFF